MRPSNFWLFRSFHISQTMNPGKTSHILFNMGLLKTFLDQFSTISVMKAPSRIDRFKNLPPLAQILLPQLHSLSRWGVVSSACWHRTRLEGPTIPHLFKFSQVKILPLNRSHKNKVIFGQWPRLQTLHHFFSVGRSVAPLASSKTSLTLNFLGALNPHLIWSGPSLI